MKSNCRTSDVGMIYKNVIVLGFGFMLLFTAFGGTCALQSSINPAGLGTAALAALYVAMMLANLFLPSVVIRWLGCKWAVVLSAVTYVPYVAAQYYPSYSTLIPAAVILGIGASTLWVGNSLYVLEMAKKFKLVTGTSEEIGSSRFFGITSTLFSSSAVWGSLVSSTVFSTDDKLVNSSLNMSEENCGSHYSPKYEYENNNSPKLPSTEKINYVLGIYLVCMVISCLILSVGLSSIPRSGKRVESKYSFLQLLLSTITSLKDPKIFLLMPISFSSGLTMAFNSADYNQAFITCVLGVHLIGFLNICEGACSSLSSFASGWLAKYTGRLAIVLTVAILGLALYISLLFWRPTSGDMTIYFIVSGVIGICSGAWGVHVKALGGQASSEQKEGFYSSHGFFESLGFIIGYAYSYFLPTWVKIVVVIVSLCVGTIGFVIVDVSVRRRPTMYTVQQ